MRVRRTANDAVCDEHDVSVILPSSFKMKLLSRAPLSTHVATLGAFCTEFKAENLRFTAFVGFSQKPMNMDPYVRFIAVKVKSDTEICRSEGMYIEGDPFDTGSQSGSGRKPESYINRFCPDESVVHAKMCYNVISGIYRIISELNLLDGKGFEPLMKTSEVLFSPVGKNILASFVKDPRHGFSAVMDMVLNHIHVDPLQIDAYAFNNPIDANAILYGIAHATARAIASPYFVKRASMITHFDHGPLSASLEVNPGVYRRGTVFSTKDGTVLSLLGTGTSPNTEEVDPAYDKAGYIRVVEHRGSPGSIRGPGIGTCVMHIPWPIRSKGPDGMLLSGTLIENLFLELEDRLEGVT